MQLTLQDFDNTGDPPSWLPAQKWEDVMAVSVLPGPLDSLCVHLANNDEAWKNWYQHSEPETLALPLNEQGWCSHYSSFPNPEISKLMSIFLVATPEDGSRPESEQPAKPAREPATDFHKLLLIRLLRPDRFPIAMAHYVSANMELDADVEPNISLERLMEALSCGMGGVLVLLPTDSNSQRLTKMLTTTPPVECIQRIAQSSSIECTCLAVGCGNDMEILKAIEKAERDDHWVLIEA